MFIYMNFFFFKFFFFLILKYLSQFKKKLYIYPNRQFFTLFKKQINLQLYNNKDIVARPQKWKFLYKLLNLKQKLFSVLLFQKFFFKFLFSYSRYYSRKLKKIHFFSNKFKKIHLILLENFKIKNLLLINKFFFNQTDIFFAIKHKYIFVNRKSLKNENYFCKIFDLIELIVFKDFFFYNINIYILYLKSKFFKNYLKINKRPKKILDIFFLKKFNKIILNSFEIDFFSFSCFLIKSVFFNLLFKLKFFLLIFNYKFYQWKKLL